MILSLLHEPAAIFTPSQLSAESYFEFSPTYLLMLPSFLAEGLRMSRHFSVFRLFDVELSLRWLAGSFRHFRRFHFEPPLRRLPQDCGFGYFRQPFRLRQVFILMLQPDCHISLSTLAPFE